MQKLMFGLFKMLSYMTILILFVILGFIVYRGQEPFRGIS